MPHCEESSTTVVRRKGSLVTIHEEWSGRGFQAFYTGDRSSAEVFGERRARQIACRHWVLKSTTGYSSQGSRWKSRTTKRTSGGICVIT